MKNKGFTLTEMLAVIVVLGIVMVLALPTAINTFYKSRHKLDEYEKKNIIDAGKLYLTDLDEGNIEFEIPETKNVNGKPYNNGDKISGYDFRVYLIEKGDIEVNLRKLVSLGYYDKECNYKKPESCKVKKPDECKLKLKIDGEKVQDRYWVSNAYEAEIIAGCEL